MPAVAALLLAEAATTAMYVAAVVEIATIGAPAYGAGHQIEKSNVQKVHIAASMTQEDGNEPD